MSEATIPPPTIEDAALDPAAIYGRVQRDSGGSIDLVEAICRRWAAAEARAAELEAALDDYWYGCDCGQAREGCDKCKRAGVLLGAHRKASAPPR